LLIFNVPVQSERCAEKEARDAERDAELAAFEAELQAVRASNEGAKKKRQQAYAQLALEHAEQEDRRRRKDGRMTVAARTESLLAKWYVVCYSTQLMVCSLLRHDLV
jgi:hypothetical protein